MKKTYFSPETKVYNILVNTTILTMSGGEVNLEEESPEDPGGAAKRRPNGKNVDFGQGFDNDFEDESSNLWE